MEKTSTPSYAAVIFFFFFFKFLHSGEKLQSYRVTPLPQQLHRKLVFIYCITRSLLWTTLLNAFPFCNSPFADRVDPRQVKTILYLLTLGPFHQKTTSLSFNTQSIPASPPPLYLIPAKCWDSVSINKRPYHPCLLPLLFFPNFHTHIAN